MANIRFDDIELSSLGISVRSFDGRKMAPFKVESIELPGRSRMGDVSRILEQGQQFSIGGSLSADTEDWELYTHDEWLARLRQVKKAISPFKGFRKLIVSGDNEDEWRWARYVDMSLSEEFPVFKRPMHPISITFQALEPYWRAEAQEVGVTVVPTEVPNEGDDAATPIIDVSIGGKISAFQGARLQPAVLFTIDDMQVGWKGNSDNDEELNAGDVLRIDSENLVVLHTVANADPVNVVRNYEYSGPGAFKGNGFPAILEGGSTVSQVHSNVASLNIQYDHLYF